MVISPSAFHISTASMCLVIVLHIKSFTIVSKTSKRGSTQDHDTYVNFRSTSLTFGCSMRSAVHLLPSSPLNFSSLSPGDLFSPGPSSSPKCLFYSSTIRWLDHLKVMMMIVMMVVITMIMMVVVVVVMVRIMIMVVLLGVVMMVTSTWFG